MAEPKFVPPIEPWRINDMDGVQWPRSVVYVVSVQTAAGALRARLMAAGIPEKEIAFIHGAETDAQKAALFRAVREGRVRVLLGSTAKMGVGTNVQTRLVALHHLDAP